jgi:hypothetical protein
MTLTCTYIYNMFTATTLTDKFNQLKYRNFLFIKNDKQNIKHCLNSSLIGICAEGTKYAINIKM